MRKESNNTNWRATMQRGEESSNANKRGEQQCEEENNVTKEERKATMQIREQ